MHAVIESLEGRTLLSASPEVIAVDRAQLAADKAALKQAIQEKTATLSADKKALAQALLAKAREAGLLRRDLIRAALQQWKIIAANQKDFRAQLKALKAEIRQDRQEILAASGDPAQQAIHQAELNAHLAERDQVRAASRAQLIADLTAAKAAFRSVRPQVKAFLEAAKPEIDALRDQLAQKDQFYADLIDELRARVLASKAKLRANLKA